MSGPAGSGGPDALVMEALEWLRDGRPEEALELLDSLAHPGAGLPLEAWRELLRAHVMAWYRERLPDAARLGCVVAPRELMRFNLPAGAGFLVSMLDGETPVADVVSLSGMDPFEARRTLARLVQAGIAEVRA